MTSEQTGIYTITSPSGRYVGGAMAFRKRWWSHLRLLRKNRHHSPMLQGAFNKYGENGLYFSQIIICEKENLTLYEQLAIDSLKPAYNVLKFARSSLGSKHSPETRARIGASKIGIPRPAWIIERLRASKFGSKDSPETLAKKSAGLRGLKRSPEQIENIRRGLIGRVVSAETRKKISEAGSGRKLSPEHAEIARTAALGLKRSDEDRHRKSIALKAFCEKNAQLIIDRNRSVHLGKKRSAETCARISAAMKARSEIKRNGN